MNPASAFRSSDGLTPAATIPWLDGPLLAFLTKGSVLDIKAPGDPDGAPVVNGATVKRLAAGGADEPAADAEAPAGIQRYDAIFSRDALALAADPAATLATWFGALRAGGHLVIVLPEAADEPDAPALGQGGSPLNPTSRAQPGAAPAGAAQAQALTAPPPYRLRPLSVTADMLMGFVDTGLAGAAFRLVHFSASPARRPAGVEPAVSTELRLVLRRLPPPALPAPDPAETPSGSDVAPSAADVSIPFMRVQHNPLKTPGMRLEAGLLVRDFAPAAGAVQRILVLKLDHYGDFVIALPALRELRQAFPEAYIRIVCGRWNVAPARASGLADDVRSFEYFPERAAEWTGAPASPGWAGFAEAVSGYFDLAIDLRVDEDTRALLGRVDAGLRCGIGSQARFPMLDIVLPDASREPMNLLAPAQGGLVTDGDGHLFLAPDAFESAMDVRTPAFHESGFPSPAQVILRSGRFLLPPGDYSAAFDVQVSQFLPGIFGVGVGIDVLADGRSIAAKVFGRRSIAGLNAVAATLRFQAQGRPSAIEFCVKTEGKPLRGRLRFAGLHLRRLDANGGRFSPSELHVGEKLSLLVSLIRQRTVPLVPAVQDPPRPGAGSGELSIVVAPFSNSTIRDWPLEHYAALIGLLIGRRDWRVTILGSPAQVGQAGRLMRMLERHDGRGRVSNRVGHTQWSEIPGILQAADLVICNNSGIAHQSAALGARTLAIYSASHQPLEWGPRGPRARAVMMSVACSPCGYERIEDCVNDHLCMRLITPEAVLAQIVALID
jgi:ADP-heptose:LPS heptosyltransferase